MRKDLVGKSRLLSKVLRHDPMSVGLSLDAEGWAEIEDVLKCTRISKDELEEIVSTNEKRRFVTRDNRIRANQGHSIDVDLNLPSVRPPEILWHGTGQKSVDSIVENGLIKGSRQHVHLSINKETAISVGARHGKPALFEVSALKMHEAGFIFYVSENGVWLTDFVPPTYLNQIK